MNRNPFNRTAEVNKSLHKSDSFFNKVDLAEVDKTKRKFHLLLFQRRYPKHA